jgi:PTS system fructose-specific IIC component
MGGPVNKVAYTFGVAGLTAAGTSTTGAGLTHMAAVMAAGMTPPLGLALATVVRKNLFTEAERENGKAAWVLGASFITEGAIPFAAADPARVIPSIMVGSAVTGGLVEAFGNTLRAPHGGIAVLPLIGGVGTYIIAIVVGTVVTAAAVVIAKGIGAKADA